MYVSYELAQYAIHHTGVCCLPDLSNALYIPLAITIPIFWANSLYVHFKWRVMAIGTPLMLLSTHRTKH